MSIQRLKTSKSVAVVSGMVAMRRWCGASLQNGDVGRYLRPLCKQVPVLMLFAVSGFVSGCILPTRVGGYPVTGTVVDRCTGAPIEGVTVFLEYKAMNVFGPRQVNGEPVSTNKLGSFYIPPRSVTMMGGSGGLAGETQKWPTVVYFKDGYSPRPGAMTKFSGRGKAPITPRDFQDMILQLFKYGEKCPDGS